MTCKLCNDEGIVHTHEGEIIGPCDCVAKPLTREKLEESATAFEEMGYAVHVTGKFLRELVATAKQGVEALEILYEVETNADPAGRARELVALRENVKALELVQSENDKLRAAVERGVRETLDTPENQSIALQALGWTKQAADQAEICDGPRVREDRKRVREILTALDAARERDTARSGRDSKGGAK